FDGPLPLEDEFRWSEFRFDTATDPSGGAIRVCLSVVPLGERRRAEERLRIMAEAGALLTATADEASMLTNLARLAVPDLADCCVIAAGDADGRPALVASSHVLPDKERLLDELMRQLRASPNHRFVLAEVLRTGRPLFVPLTSAGFNQAVAHDGNQLRLLETLRIRSYLCVPLIARGVTLGALFCAITESERRLEQADLALAEELARRAAAALDQARLLRAAQEASRAKDATLALLDTVLATAPVGFALLDTQLRQVRVNDALAALCGAPADTLIGRRLDEALPGFAAPMVTAARQVRLSGRPVIDLELSGETAAWKCQLFPIRVDDEALGVGVLVIDTSGERRATEERMRLLEREQAARAEAELAAHMIERIQAVSDAALAHLDLDDLLVELLHRVSELMRVDEATILLVDESGQRLVVRAAEGLAVPPDLRVGVPLGEGFVGRIARDRTSIVVEQVTEEEVPHTFLVERIASMIGVPLVLEERVIGVLHVGSTRPRLFRPSELRLLQFAADRIALAIDRSSLFEAERLAQRRLAFLAEASGVLSRTLEVEEALARVSELAVPEIADVCTVNLVEDDGSFRRLSMAHHDSALDHLAEISVGRFPIDLADPRITAMRVFRTGQSMLFPEIAPDELAGIIGDRRQVELLGDTPFCSGMMVPLVTGGRAIGMMGFWLTSRKRIYTPNDVALAEDLARRAAEAYERARLYRETVAAVRVREEFLSIASHELKTPLTTIKGYVQMLDRQLRRPLPEASRLRQAMDNLQGQLERFQGLVNDLLDMSQIQRGRLELHPSRFDLVALAGEVLERFEHGGERTEAHTLVLEAPEPVVGEWDASRLDQVLTNLISNALKYSPDGGEVRVTVRQAGALAEVVVDDRGIGITPDELRTLFQPFSRGERVRSLVEGTGLGLYITHEIVEQHGGTVSVASQPDSGSRFSVQLPLHRPPSDPNGRSDEPRR
ncbi:MAG TPA: GAF domain-containing protein, partial [Thermomicrobiaceae bacterium]|nr:GAF domain-containing protein [Thermomicrobiaceae bacterium]